MSDAQIAEESPDPEKSEKKKKRKKDKVRSAWISFTGRIVAQIVGAVATVALGVTVLHKSAAPDAHSRPEKNPIPARQSTPVSALRPDGGVSVAVLPLENFSPDPEQEYFADSMTETLIASLSKVNGPRVISRTSSMLFKGRQTPLREIAQQLGVRWIVEGSVASANNRVRITAQLIDAETDQHAWAESYDRPVTDVLAMQAEVASAITRAVSATLLTRQQERPSQEQLLSRGMSLATTY